MNLSKMAVKRNMTVVRVGKQSRTIWAYGIYNTSGGSFGSTAGRSKAGAIWIATRNISGPYILVTEKWTGSKWVVTDVQEPKKEMSNGNS